MKEIKVFDKVSDFQPTDEGLFIWMDGKVYLEDKLIYDKKPNAVYYSNGVFFIVENNWKDSVFIDPVMGFNYSLKGIGGMICFIDSKSIMRNVWNEEYTISKRQKIDLESGSIIWETEIGKPYINSSHFFGVLGTKLCKVNPNTGQPLWQLDLPEKYGTYSINGEDAPVDVQGYIGVYSGCLYIKAGNKLILGIDVISGEERFCFEYVGERVLLDNLRLDMSKGVIFSIGSMEYFELDLSSHQSEVAPIKVSDVETTKLGSWENNIVYFWEGGANSNFGLFDRDSKEVKVVQNLNVSGYPAIKDIKHSKGKVYVLDGNNSLHIFQRK